VTLTLTLDRVILHSVMHRLSTSTYVTNVIEIEETFCGRTDGHLRPTLLSQLGEVDLIIDIGYLHHHHHHRYDNDDVDWWPYLKLRWLHVQINEADHGER